VVGGVHHDLPALVALASELHAEIIGGILRDREEDAVAVELEPIGELDGVQLSLGRVHPLDVRIDHRDLERVEPFQELVVQLRLVSVGADDELVGPCRE
jgi:hypothetical protein